MSVGLQSLPSPAAQGAFENWLKGLVGGVVGLSGGSVDVVVTSILTCTSSSIVDIRIPDPAAPLRSADRDRTLLPPKKCAVGGNEGRVGEAGLPRSSRSR